MAARQHIDAGGIPARRIGRLVDQHLNHTGNCFLPAVLKRIFKIGSRNVNQWEFGKIRIFLPNELDVSLDVIPLGFRHTRRANPDEFRLGPIVDVEDRLLDILKPAKDGRNLTHRGRLKRNGLLEMPNEKNQSKRRAPLRAMQQRHRPPQSHEGERPADRLTHFQRINSTSLFANGDLSHLLLRGGEEGDSARVFIYRNVSQDLLNPDSAGSATARGVGFFFDAFYRSKRMYPNGIFNRTEINTLAIANLFGSPGFFG